MSADWPVVRLGDHCLKIGSGATPRGGKNVYLDSGNATLIRSQNVYNDGFKSEGIVYITQAAADKLSNAKVQEKDILINITGDSVARTCIAPNHYLPARVNQHVAIIRPKPEEFDARFLRYFLASPIQQDLLLTIASAGATRNALTKGQLESLEVCKPSLQEQRAIARQLESLDNKIQSNQQINQTLEQMAQAIFKSWFVDFEPVKAKMAALEAGGNEDDALLAAMQAIAGSALFATDVADADAHTQLARLQTEHPEQYTTLRATAELFPAAMQDSELGEIPEGWEATDFGAVSVCFDKHRIPLSKAQRDKRQGHIPYYGATSVMDYVDEHIFDDIYLLLGEDGSVLQKDDTPFIQYIWGKAWVNNHAHVLQGKGNVSTEQILLFMKNQNIAPYVTGAVQLKLNQKNMNSIPFIKATDEVCVAFNLLLKPMFADLRNREDESRMLSSLRDTLLPKLLSGELSLAATEEQLADTVEPAHV